jgi:hypothetical protein
MQQLQPSFQPNAAFPQPQAQKEPNIWLRLTSSGWDTPQVTVGQREMARRSRLVSWIILGLIVIDIVLIPAGFTDMPTLIAILLAAVGLIVAAVLNRASLVTFSGSLLVLLVMGAVLGAVIGASPGLDTIYLPAYDLLAIAVVLAASILPRFAAFVVATLNIALITSDFFLQDKTGDLLRQFQAEGALPLIARPIALQIIIATVAYLWVRGTDEAIRRADRAEEMAQLEHEFAEQRRQLEVSAQQLLEAHVRVANGDYTARAPLSQDNVLWQVAASLNNLITRIQRAGDAEFKLRRTEEEMMRVVAAIDDANGGRRPLWPAPTGTVVDELLRRVASGQRPRQPAGPPPGLRPPAPPQSHSFAQPSSYPPGTGPMAPAGYPAQGGFAPQMPVTGGLGGDNGWPSLSTGGGHASLATDNPWVLPADE